MHFPGKIRGNDKKQSEIITFHVKSVFCVSICVSNEKGSYKFSS